MRAIHSRGHTGFTLVEILIALAILALLSVMGYRAVAALAGTESHLSAEAQRWRDLDGAFTRFEADCREAEPREVRVGAGMESAWFATVDARGNSVLRISRAGPEFTLEPGSAGQRIGYRVENGRLEVLYWPALDLPEHAVPAAYALAGDVASLRLAFLDSHGAWRDRWPVLGESALPRAVRLTLQLTSGEALERWIALQ